MLIYYYLLHQLTTELHSIASPYSNIFYSSGIIYMKEYTAFFYGTLMHPKILKAVIRNNGSHLRICPAVILVRVTSFSIGKYCLKHLLQDYTRHKVKVNINYC